MDYWEENKSFVFVCKVDIQAFALVIAPHFDLPPEIFKASRYQLDFFYQRYELCLRRSTIPLKLDDAEIIKRALVDGVDLSK